MAEKVKPISEKRLIPLEKYIGTILGLAAGDALGYPVEFLSIDQIKERGGSEFIYLSSDFSNHSSNHPKGTYSDDTQMSIALANALLKSKTARVDEVMYHIGREFIKWYDSPENDRAPGTNCMAGVRNLRRGCDWKDSGVDNAKSCGAAMRTAPIGLAFYNDLGKLKEIAAASAISTHNSKSAEASAIANAYLVARGIRNENPQESLNDLEKFTEGISNSFSYKLRELEGTLNLEPREAFKIIGAGWRGDEAVAGALYCVLKTDFDYREAVVMAADNAGDSDSVASIAGGIIGSHIGFKEIPRLFLRDLENRDNLYKLAVSLYDRFKK